MFLHSTPSISPEICSLFLILKQWNTCCSSEPYHCQQLWAYKHYKDTRYQGQDTVPNRSWIYKQFHSQINLRFMKIRKFRSSQEQRLSTRPEVAKFQITIQRHSTATVRINCRYISWTTRQNYWNNAQATHQSAILFVRDEAESLASESNDTNSLSLYSSLKDILSMF